MVEPAQANGARVVLADHAARRRHAFVDYLAMLDDRQSGFISRVSQGGVHPNAADHDRMTIAARTVLML